MPPSRLSPEAVRRTATKLRDELGRTDRDRLDALLPLFRNAPQANLGTVLAALYPAMEHDAALTAFRQFRKRLRDSAAEAGMDLQLEADSQTRSAPDQRLCWFEGADGAVEAATQLVKEETEDVRRSPQGAFELRGGKTVIRYFLSFAHDDETLKKDLLKRLEQFLRNSAHYHFDIWHDGLILPGDRWHDEIQRAIENCHFGLLLVSPAFLASGYIRQHELPRFVPADGEAADDSKRAIPVAVKPLLFDGSLDLKGLQHRQVFRDAEGKAFSERSGNKKDTFAQELFQRIVQVIGKRIVAAPQEESPRRAFEREQHAHLGRKLDECHFIPTAGFPSSLDKLDTERKPDGKNELPRIDALNYLLEWTRDADAPAYCALLGEYGMGKTTTCMAFAQALLHARQQDKALPLPIYLDLRHVGDKALSGPALPEILDEVLRRSWRGGHSQIDLAADDVIRLVQQEGALAIFDGLDEVLVHLTPSAGQRFTRELLRILPPRKARGKNAGRLLLSCRTHYFRTLRDQKNLLLGEDREPLAPQDYRAFVLLPFTDEQIRRYFKETLPDQDPDRLMDLIGAVHNLPEMAERPYTLGLIARHIPQIEQWKLDGRHVTGVALYRHMILSWLERDDGKHQLTPEHKQRLMEHFAAELWRSGRRTWAVGDIEQWLVDLLRARPEIAAHYEGKDRELLKEDLRTATFLVREGEDQFRFAHTSLQEFFLACHLQRALLEHAPERWALPMASPETLDFLGQLLTEDAATRDAAMKTLRALRDAWRPQASELAFAYALRANEKDHPAPPQSGVRLEGANLRHLTVQGQPERRFNLRGAVFTGTKLEEAVFHHADLEGADFSHAALARAECLHCRAPSARFGAAALAGTVFRDAQLAGADFTAARCHRTQWLCCSLDGAIELPLAAPAGFFARSNLRDDQANPPAPAKVFPAIRDGHAVMANAVAFSPDGVRIASGAGDTTLRLWDADSGECVAILAGHQGAVHAVAFSPDGARIASGGTDRAVRLWDADRGECIATFEKLQGQINTVAFSPDGAHIVSGGADRALRLWDANSGKCVAILSGHDDTVTGAAFSPDGVYIASVAGDATLRLWDIRNGRCTATLTGHQGGVNAVAFSPDGQRIASCAGDAALRLWDIDSGECVATLAGHRSGVTCVAFSPDGTRIISGGWDRTLRLWDANSSECVATIAGHQGEVNAVAFSPNGVRFVSATWNGALHLWDTESGECIATLVGHEHRITAVTFSPDGARIASGADDNTLRLWDADCGKCVAILAGHRDWVTAVTFSPDGARIVSGADDNTLRLWDADRGECIATLVGHEHRITAVTFSPDGARIASGGWDTTLRLWDANSGECIATLARHERGINAVAFSPDGARIASGAGDNTLRLWDADSGECIATLDGHEDAVRAVAFSPDGARIASGADDTTLRLWDADSGECIATLDGHQGIVNAVAFSPDGARIASGAGDNTLHLWDADSGECIATLAGHEGWVSAVAFSPDGSHLAASGAAGIFLYDAQSLELLRRIHLFPNDTWISIDSRRRQVTKVHGEAWRWLRWSGVDPATGRMENWPAEIFGPLPE